MQDKQSTAMASLLLELSQNSDNLVGPSVSDEELAAFLDNTLDTTRRAQVSSYLANDPETYSRWMRLVENIDLLKPDAQEESASIVSIALKRLFDFFKAKSLQSLFVPSATMAALALLVFIQLPQSEVDGFYADYAMVTNSQFVLPSRSYHPFLEREPLTEQAQILHVGITQGLIDLEIYQAQELRIAQDKAAAAKEAMNQQWVDGYIDLGRWAVLTQAYCSANSLGADSTFFKRSLTTLEALSVKLKTDSASTIVQKLNKLPKQAGQRQLCALAHSLVALAIET